MREKMNIFFANVRKIIAPSIVCILLLTAVSCEASREHYVDDENDIPFDVPINVPFTELLQLEACECGMWACTWVRVNTESELVVINSDRELRRHVACVRNVPAIDFSRYTLLLARGVCGGLGFSRTELQQISARSYVMNVYWSRAAMAVITHWHIAIIIDKLDRNANVRLNTTMNWSYTP